VLAGSAVTPTLGTPTGELDRITLDPWLTAQTHEPLALANFGLLSRATFSAAAAEMSLLNVLFYTASGGGLEVLYGAYGRRRATRRPGLSSDRAENSEFGTAYRNRGKRPAGSD